MPNLYIETKTILEKKDKVGELIPRNFKTFSKATQDRWNWYKILIGTSVEQKRESRSKLSHLLSINFWQRCLVIQ